MSTNTPFVQQKMRGPLKKLSGKMKGWSTRYFVLSKESLQYYTSEDCTKLLGSIPLAGTRIREILHEVEKYTFEIRPVNEKQRLTPNHESYLLAASDADERQAWISALRRSVHYAGGCFGRPLAEQIKLERFMNSVRSREKVEKIEIPMIVRQCLDYLLQHDAVEKEGIIRVGGRIKVQRDLRDEFDHGIDVDFGLVPDCGVAEVSSVLKAYLQSLPDSLIPSRFFEHVAPIGYQIHALALQNSSDALHSNSTNEHDSDVVRFAETFHRLQSTLKELPLENYNLLKELMHFMYLIHTNADKNRMPASNLAILLWPVVLKPDDRTAEMMESVADMCMRTVTIMIELYNDLFDQKTSDAVHSKAGSKVTSSSDVGESGKNDKEDARSQLHKQRIAFIQQQSANSASTPPPISSKPAGQSASKLKRYQSDVTKRRLAWQARIDGSNDSCTSNLDSELSACSIDDEPPKTTVNDTGNGSDKKQAENEAKVANLSQSPSELNIQSAYNTLKTAYKEMTRENFDLRNQVAALSEELARYRTKFGSLD